MGDPKRKDQEDFEQEALGVLNGNDPDFEEEARGVLAAGSDPNAPARTGTKMTNGELDAEQAHVMRMLQDPAYLARQLGAAGSKYIGGAVGELGAGAGALKNIAAQAGAGAITAGGDEYARSGDYWQAALAALKGAGIGAGLSGAASAAGAVAKPVANFLRRQQLDLSQGDYEKIARERGLDAAKRIGELPDELGLTNDVIPQTRGQLQSRAAAAKSGYGAAEGAAIDEAGKRLAVTDPDLVSRDQVYQDIQALQGKANNDASSNGGSMWRTYADLLDRLENRSDVSTPRDLLNLKRDYEAAAGYDKRAVANETESLVKEANRNAATSARNELGRVMEEAGPDLSAAYRGNAQRYGEAATVENAARDAAARQLGTAGRAVGGGVGSALGAAIGGPYGAAAGGTIGFVAAPAAADLALSAGGNLARGIERNAGAVSQNAGVPAGLAEALYEQRKREEEEGVY